MTTRRAELRTIIEVFSQAVASLGLRTEPAKVERWALVVHRAMTGSARMFHTNDHVVALARGGGPIESLAALFHDVVYLQVDQGLNKDLEPRLSPYVTLEPGGARVRGDAAEPWATLVLEVFGVEPGALVTVNAGANELLSALAAASELGAVVPTRELVQVAACIEATIPFRGEDAAGLGPLERLAARLAEIDARRTLGLGEAERVVAVQRAAWVANRDVESFADPDVGRFLDGTWKLLPEFNPSLRHAEVYTVAEYRGALERMVGFLGNLPANRVFHRYGGVPSDEAFEAMRARAAINLNHATRYLRLKLLAIAYLEALALATGGDAPMELFMGSLQEGGDRLEHHLPRAPTGAPPDLDPTLWALVDAGRAGDSSFDLDRAPLAAFLYRHLGETHVGAAVEQAGRLFKGELDGPGFLRTQRADLVRAVADAASHVACTRSAALLAVGRTDATA